MIVIIKDSIMFKLLQYYSGFGIISLVAHNEKYNTMTRGLTKSPWLIVDDDVNIDIDDVTSDIDDGPVKFFYFISSFFDG